MLNFIKSELSHFKNLPKKAQQLLISFFFYSTAYPMISIFISAFIWKNNNNILFLIFFRASQFLITPFAFLLGGVLLKVIKIKTLYFIGTLLIAGSSVLIIFLKNDSPLAFVYMGMLLGIGAGLYWVNRNHLTIKETNNEDRSYFFGLLFSFSTLIGFIITFMVGWLIVFGISYQLLIVIAFILIIFSGLTVFKNDHDTPTVGKFFIINSSYIWTRKRFLHLGIGLVEGLSYIIPGLLILTVLGNEGVLGTLTAISSVISAIFIYYYGRKSKSKDHRTYFIVSAISALMISLLIALAYNRFTVVIYSLLNGLIISFLWLTAIPPILKNIDLEVGQIERKRFSYLLDSEFFLDVGRIISLAVCLFIAIYFGTENSLRFSPLILSCLQIFLFVYLEKFKKSKNLTMV
ncbi:MAG: MFS transporter [Patescibacteria group bacterium]